MSQQTFFDFAAEVGLTKHVGGVEATEKLIELCKIDGGKYVLDVGCGAGVTPCFIARKTNCRVMGVDILPAMIKRSKERALDQNLANQVDFQVADAQDLPFEDNTFDVVITESVTAFPENKQKAVREYVRVVKPGGFVGLNETTWLKSPPPPEMIDWVAQDVGEKINPLTADEWESLLKKAGLKGVFRQVFHVDLKTESKGIVQRYGFGGMLGVLGRMLGLYLKNPAYRKFVKEIQKQGVVPKNLQEFFGYGIYVGRK